MSQSFWMGKWKLLDMPGILKDRLVIQGIKKVNQFFENPTLSYLPFRADQYVRGTGELEAER